LRKSQFRKHISSGGKSRVPFGGFTSIFSFCAASGATVEESNAPERPEGPPLLFSSRGSAADANADREEEGEGEEEWHLKLPEKAAAVDCQREATAVRLKERLKGT